MYVYILYVCICMIHTYICMQKAEHTNVIWPTQSFAFFRGHVYMYVYILYVCICMNIYDIYICI